MNSNNQFSVVAKESCLLPAMAADKKHLKKMATSDD